MFLVRVFNKSDGLVRTKTPINTEFKDLPFNLRPFGSNLHVVSEGLCFNIDLSWELVRNFHDPKVCFQL